MFLTCLTPWPRLGLALASLLSRSPVLVLAAITAHARFYQNRIGRFRATAKDLAQYLPEAVLAVIQATVDVQALEFVWLNLQQAAIELLAFPELEELVMQVRKKCLGPPWRM